MRKKWEAEVKVWQATNRRNFEQARKQQATGLARQLEQLQFPPDRASPLVGFRCVLELSPQP